MNERKVKRVTFASDFDNERGASKIILLLISAFVGPFGFDRMYLGCYRSGLAKLFLFIAGVVLTALAGPLGVIVLFAWFVWGFVDQVVIYVNALARWRSVPFCNARRWKDENEIQYGFYAAIALIIFNLVEYSVLAYQQRDQMASFYRSRCNADADCDPDKFCNSIGYCTKGTRKAG